MVVLYRAIRGIVPQTKKSEGFRPQIPKLVRVVPLLK